MRAQPSLWQGTILQRAQVTITPSTTLCRSEVETADGHINLERKQATSCQFGNVCQL